MLSPENHLSHFELGDITLMTFLKLGLKLAAVCITALTVISAAHAQTKLLRFPDIHGDQIVFPMAATSGRRVRRAAMRGG